MTGLTDAEKATFQRKIKTREELKALIGGFPLAPRPGGQLEGFHGDAGKALLESRELCRLRLAPGAVINRHLPLGTGRFQNAVGNTGHFRPHETPRRRQGGDRHLV